MTDQPSRFVAVPELRVVRRRDPRQHARMVTRILAELTTDWPRYFPEAPAAPRVIAVHYAPRRLSDVAKADLDAGARRIAVYIKIHKHYLSTPERVEQKARLEFETLEQLHAAMKTAAGSAVPRPVAFFPKDAAVVTEEVQGENLHGLIKRALRPWAGSVRPHAVEGHCEAAGRWLRNFQAVTLRDTQRTLLDEGVLSRLAKDLQACVARGLPRADEIRLMTFCQDRLARLDGQAFAVAGAHPDFQPDNVVARADGVSVVDFTSFCYRLPGSDLGRFLSSLEFLAKHPFASRRQIAALQAAFLRGYRVTETEAEAMAVYVVRFLARAVLSVATWPAPALVRRLRERQALGFLAAWSRRVTQPGANGLLVTG